ncbi:MAG TPA: tetratricopeptide repeat protein [Terriglobales bacterium]|nr:tetratricopeptide repeat protein [Terriglobales bacterium]
MSDIAKRLERAEKYLQKGKQDAALEEYLEALREDPRNENIRQTAADLSLTLGRARDAATLLQQLFESQAGIGDAIRAAATYKKLARVATPPVEQTFRYGQFLERAGNRREALEAYATALQGFTAAARKAESLEVLKHIILIDPSVENYKRQAALAAEMGDRTTAAAAFLKAGELEAAGGQDAYPWFESAYSHDPQNPAVVLAYARSLLRRSKPEQAMEILAPFAKAAGAAMEVRDVYADALLAARKLVEAEPFIWELFQRDPRQVNEVAGLIAALIDNQTPHHALDLARKLEEHQAKAGQRREFVAMMKDIVDRHAPDAEFWEYMVEVYNASNREHDYCDALLKLFELYFAGGNFVKAADCLDRAAEVDAYEPGHQNRLEMLRGKIDDNRFKSIAARFTGMVKSEEEKEVATGVTDNESTVLEDLMLQAEIFLQYSMRTKAVERLERINKLFPREEEKNQKLHELYVNAGITLKYAEAPPAPAVEGPPTTSKMRAMADAAPPASAPPVPVPAAVANENAVDNFARVTEITRNIYRQGSIKGVLFAAVNDIGRHWNASRCVAGLCTPGKPPSAALEYCAPGVPQSEVMAIVKLITTLQSMAVVQGVVSIPNTKTPELDSIRNYINSLKAESLLAVPLCDGDEHVGILILEQCGPRAWRPTDEVVLKTIAEQMVLAVNNARLRSLVKTLAVTDEKSGLLKRSSYIDVLLSEVKRTVQQNSVLTLMLMHFGKASAMVKELGEPAVESMMQQVGQVVTTHTRANDVAVRYELTTVAVLLADTDEKNAFFVVDKLRRALSTIKVPGREEMPPATVGIAEAVLKSNFDAVDIVTEVINRVEAALDAARAEGTGTAKSLAAQLEAAAVAGD